MLTNVRIITGLTRIEKVVRFSKKMFCLLESFFLKVHSDSLIIHFLYKCVGRDINLISHLTALSWLIPFSNTEFLPANVCHSVFMHPPTNQTVLCIKEDIYWSSSLHSRRKQNVIQNKSLRYV